KKGCFFKKASYQDCEQLFGKETLLHVQKCLEERKEAEILCNSAALYTYDSKGLLHQKILNLIKNHGLSRELQHEMLRTMILNKKNENILIIMECNGYPPVLEENLLYYAISCNNPKALHSLMDNCRHFISNNKDKQTLLEYARSSGDAKCLKVVRYNMQNKLNQFLRSNQIFHEQNECSEVAQLIALNTDVNPLSGNDAPLYRAIQNSCLQCIQLLIDHNADVNWRASKNAPIINYVLKNYKGSIAIRIIKTLIIAGIAVNQPNCLVPNTDSDHEDNNNKITLLEWIIRSNFWWTAQQEDPMIPFLLEHGALVKKEMIMHVESSYVKQLLQQAYDQQYCCVCLQHPADINNIPCANKHTNDFL
ncbi:MAG TPA: hypothetical protein VKR58_01190, partial [Aquella sp.]|nr:hypothetical protein [Aquella sp.]